MSRGCLVRFHGTRRSPGRWALDVGVESGEEHGRRWMEGMQVSQARVGPPGSAWTAGVGRKGEQRSVA